MPSIRELAGECLEQVDEAACGSRGIGNDGPAVEWKRGEDLALHLGDQDSALWSREFVHVGRPGDLTLVVYDGVPDCERSSFGGARGRGERA